MYTQVKKETPHKYAPFREVHVKNQRTPEAKRHVGANIVESS